MTTLTKLPQTSPKSVAKTLSSHKGTSERVTKKSSTPCCRGRAHFGNGSAVGSAVGRGGIDDGIKPGGSPNGGVVPDLPASETPASDARAPASVRGATAVGAGAGVAAAVGVSAGPGVGAGAALGVAPPESADVAGSSFREQPARTPQRATTPTTIVVRFMVRQSSTTPRQRKSACRPRLLAARPNAR